MQKGWKKNSERWRKKETDYRNICLSKKQLVLGIFGGILLSVGVAFLFYRSAAAMLLAVFFVPYYLSKKKKEYVRVQKAHLLQQFKSGMQMVSGTLAAGYSIENAWRSAQVEIGRLYGAEAEFYLELKRMNRKVRMNEPFEKILSDFAYRTGIEDICNFAEIFRYARRSGGNVTEIIRTTVSRMQEKEDILSEIQNAVAAKKMEQRMMNIMFPGILLFVTLGSPEYVDSLYGTLPGVLIMSICLAGYLFACHWSEKLVDIQV